MEPARACPACGARSSAEATRLNEMMFGLDETFDYLTCSECGTLYIAEVPADLPDYYTTKYYSFDLDPQATMGRPGVRQVVGTLGRSILFGQGRVAGIASRAPVRQVRTLIALYSSLRLAGLPQGRDTRILDVGSGAGALVFALGLAGLRDVTGIDPFNAADRTLSTGARVLRRDVGDLKGTYDVVMLHHSFEHVPDPAATLQQAGRLLAPGGRLLIRMPTVSSAAYERYGRDWIQLDPPRHLTLFSREGMARRAAASGFSVEAVADDSTSFQFWGSEQARDGVPLAGAGSHFIDPRRSGFSAAQLRDWDRRSAELNACSRGDQAAWVLRPV